MKILVTDHYTPEHLSLLENQLACRVVRSRSHQPTAEELESTEVLLIRSKTQVNTELLKQAKKLKLVITSTSGFDHIDLHACTEKDIVVMHTPKANIQSVTELTFSLMLQLIRNMKQSTEVIKNNQWKSELPMASEISGKTLGLIGLGRIGTSVAKVGQAFNMTVIAHDPYKSDEYFEDLSVKKCQLNEVLKEADIISLHVPLTNSTQKMINKQCLSQISPHALLVNTSRGPVVDEAALLEALNRQQLQAAALDVFDSEPITSQHPLLQLPSFIATPHIGAYTKEAFHRASYEAVMKVIHFYKENRTTDDLPPNELWLENDKACQTHK